LWFKYCSILSTCIVFLLLLNSLSSVSPFFSLFDLFYLFLTVQVLFFSRWLSKFRKSTYYFWQIKAENVHQSVWKLLWRLFRRCLHCSICWPNFNSRNVQRRDNINCLGRHFLTTLASNWSRHVRWDNEILELNQNTVL
jgi:hypothetical protein